MPGQVLVLGSHPASGWSMRRYTEVLVRAYRHTAMDVRKVTPPSTISRHFARPSATKFAKYIESLVIFPWRAALAARRADLVHIADHSDALWLLIARFSKPVVVTCHDLFAVRAALGEIPEHRTRLSGRIYQRAVLAGLRRASLIVAVSHATANDVRRLVPHVDVTVVHNPVDMDVSQAPQSEGSPRQHVIIVSSVGWRKRREHAIRVWTKLRETSELTDVKLTLVGPELTPSERALLSDDERDDVSILRAVSNDTLARAYSEAIAVIQTSRYEGFGWPIVEGQVFGAPALCDDQPVLREIGGEGAAYIADNLQLVEWEDVAQTLTDPLMRVAAKRNAQRFNPGAFTSELVRTVGPLVRHSGKH